MRTFGLAAAILLHWQTVLGQLTTCPDMTPYNCVTENETGATDKDGVNCQPCKLSPEVLFNPIIERCRISDAKDNKDGVVTVCTKMKEFSSKFNKGDGSVSLILDVNFQSLKRSKFSATLSDGKGKKVVELGLTLEVDPDTEEPVSSLTNDTTVSNSSSLTEDLSGQQNGSIIRVDWNNKKIMVGKFDESSNDTAESSSLDATASTIAADSKDSSTSVKDSQTTADSNASEKDSPTTTDSKVSEKDSQAAADSKISETDPQTTSDSKVSEKDSPTTDDSKASGKDSQTTADSKAGENPKETTVPLDNTISSEISADGKVSTEESALGSTAEPRTKRETVPGVKSMTVKLSEKESEFTYKIIDIGALMQNGETDLEIRISRVIMFKSNNKTTKRYAITIGNTYRLTTSNNREATAVDLAKTKYVCGSEPAKSSNNNTSGISTRKDCAGIIKSKPSLALMAYSDAPRPKTVHGAVCLDQCVANNIGNYFQCTTQSWNYNGQRWMNWDFCSIDTYTAHGFSCTSPCKGVEKSNKCPILKESVSYFGFPSGTLCKEFNSCEVIEDFCVPETKTPAK